MALMVSHTPSAVAAENNPDEIREFLAWFYSDEDFQQEHVQYPLLNVATVKPSDITDRPYAVYWASEEFNCILNRAEDYLFEYVKLSENAIRVQVKEGESDYFHYFRNINNEWYLYDIYTLEPLLVFTNADITDNSTDLIEFCINYFTNKICRENNTILPELYLYPVSYKGYIEKSFESVDEENLNFEEYSYGIDMLSKDMFCFGIAIADTDIGTEYIFRLINNQWYLTDNIDRI